MAHVVTVSNPQSLCAVKQVVPARRWRTPIPRVGPRLRQTHAQKPIRPAKTTKHNDINGSRNWHRHRSMNTHTHTQKAGNWPSRLWHGEESHIGHKQCTAMRRGCVHHRVGYNFVLFKMDRRVRGLTGAHHVLSTVVVPWFFVLRSELLKQSEASTLHLQLGTWNKSFTWRTMCLAHFTFFLQAMHTSRYRWILCRPLGFTILALGDHQHRKFPSLPAPLTPDPKQVTT